MDNRRLIIVMVFAAVWFALAPRLFPQLFPKPKPRVPAANAAAVEDAAQGAADPASEPAGPLAALPQHPARLITLGPRPGEDPADPSRFVRVTINTRGAAIDTAELLGREYTNLERTAPVKIVGNHLGPGDQDAAAPPRRLLEAVLPQLEAQLKTHNTSLAHVNWEVVPSSETANSVALRFVSLDGSLQLEKSFTLNAGDPKRRDEDVNGYLLSVDWTITNLRDQAVETQYRLIGPTGLPLEDVENVATYIELKAGTQDDPTEPDSVTPVTLTARALRDEQTKAADQQDPGLLTVWRKPLKYAGADVQCFTALLCPGGNQAADADGDGAPDAYFSEVRPFVLRSAALPERSDVSLEFVSRPLVIPAKQSIVHKFDLYFGPKRSALLAPLGAEALMNYGWWGSISRMLLGLLNFFHHTAGLPYALAIILLTVCVRGVLFPISIRQAGSAAKMKEIQPELAALRKQYSNEPEKFVQAQRDLFRKHQYNPFAGCLPVLLQLPIFIGLYNALSHAVDLRLARLWYIDNLAAPDGLFQFGFRIPFLGWHELNVLPLVVVALFIWQQKLFMPPPTNDEERLQQKMFMGMTVLMGFMFYKSQAGLCLYFIASSLWGIVERKLLDRMKPHLAAREARKKEQREAARAERKPGWLDKLLEAADQARQQTNGKPEEAPARDRKDKKGFRSSR